MINQLFALLLALTLLPGGGLLDLCGCGPLEHGALCDMPTIEVESSCCSSAGEQSEESVGAQHCPCPVVDFDQRTAEQERYGQATTASLCVVSEAEAVTQPCVDSIRMRWPAPRAPPAQRLYLLHSCFLL